VRTLGLSNAVLWNEEQAVGNWFETIDPANWATLCFPTRSSISRRFLISLRPRRHESVVLGHGPRTDHPALL